MGKTAYKIVAIKPGMSHKYHEYWVEHKTVSDDGTELRSDLLANIDIIEATSKKIAEAEAEKKFPGHQIIATRLG
jgi:hypothetical protein